MDDSEASMDADDADVFAKNIANLLRNHTAYTAADLYENGRRRPLSELVAMARYSSIWPLLSDLERQQIHNINGVLAHGRSYISREVIPVPPLRQATTFVVTSDGSRMDI